MPRPLRLEFANGLYHVTNRGVERRNIVVDHRDRRTWLRLLDRIATRCQWRVFAYVLLDNHFHLYLRTPKPNLSSGMHDLESGYASLFNRNHERVGPLFQGRFHSVVVENDSHSWELTRYLHLNPVRAGLTDSPLAYRWSSYGCYLNPRGAPAWLDWKTVLAEFGASESAARVAYKRFVEAGIAAPPANPLGQAADGWILGSEAFVEKCRQAGEANDWAARALTGQDVLDRVVEFYGVSANQIVTRGRHDNTARQAAILLCRELVDEPLEAAASRFHISRTGVVQAATRARHRAEADPSFREALDVLRAELRR